MKCSIISSKDKREFDNIKSITLPAFFGEMQILPDHAESFVVLQKGQIILDSSKNNSLPIEGGVCHIKDNAIIIIE